MDLALLKMLIHFLKLQTNPATDFARPSVSNNVNRWSKR